MCRATLGRYAERLARGLASVINLIDPDAIVLGGGLSGISALYEHVPRLWTRYIFSDRVVTRLLPPVHGDSSGSMAPPARNSMACCSVSWAGPNSPMK